MEIKKIIFAIIVAFSVFTACKNDSKKENKSEQILTASTKTIALNISGMTCEIGCAKTIQSKLSKKEGVTNAKVVFEDSLATVSYDSTKISKEEIMGFVEGIAGGELYKTTETKICNTSCKKICCTDKNKSSCKTDCKKECCEEKKACKTDCKKVCCTSKDKKECSKDCEKACCADKKA